MSQPISHRQNTMIRNRLRKRLINMRRLYPTGNYKKTSHTLTQRSSSRKQIIISNKIQLTHKLTCIIVNLLITFFKLIQFLKHYNRQINVIFLKIP